MMRGAVCEEACTALLLQAGALPLSPAAALPCAGLARAPCPTAPSRTPRKPSAPTRSAHTPPPPRALGWVGQPLPGAALVCTLATGRGCPPTSTRSSPLQSRCWCGQRCGTAWQRGRWSGDTVCPRCQGAAWDTVCPRTRLRDARGWEQAPTVAAAQAPACLVWTAVLQPATAAVSAVSAAAASPHVSCMPLQLALQVQVRGAGAVGALGPAAGHAGDPPPVPGNMGTTMWRVLSKSTWVCLGREVEAPDVAGLGLGPQPGSGQVGAVARVLVVTLAVVQPVVAPASGWRGRGRGRPLVAAGVGTTRWARLAAAPVPLAFPVASWPQT